MHRNIFSTSMQLDFYGLQYSNRRKIFEGFSFGNANSINYQQNVSF